MKQIYNDPEARNIAIWLLGDVEVLIEEKREEFICIALDDVANFRDFDLVRAVAYQLREYIAQALGKPTYEIFFDHHFGHHKSHGSVYHSGRVAWIKDMIAALEKGEALPARPSLPPGFAWPESKPVKFNLWEK